MSTLPPLLLKLQQRLAEDQTKQSAWAVINEYFSFFQRESINKELWMLTVGTLTNDIMPPEKEDGPHERVFFYEYTKLFYDAVHLLYNKRRKKSVSRR